VGREVFRRSSFFSPVENFLSVENFFCRSRIVFVGREFFTRQKVFGRSRVFLSGRDFFWPVERLDENFLWVAGVFLPKRIIIWKAIVDKSGRDYF